MFSRYRDGGGAISFRDWEFSSGVSGWDDAPAPAHVGKRLVEGLFATELPGSKARLVNNVTHWAFGVLNGIGYGIVASSLREPRVRYGLPFGSGGGY